MYWRRSLAVTAVLVTVGFILGSISNVVLALFLNQLDLPVSQYAGIYSLVGFVQTSIVHFLILWVAFRYFGQSSEKRKRGSLNAAEVLDMLDEDDLAELRERLIPPSQRSGL